MELEKAKFVSHRVVALNGLSKQQKTLTDALIKLRGDVYNFEVVREEIFSMLISHFDLSECIDMVEFMIERAEKIKMAIEREIENVD